MKNQNLFIRITVHSHKSLEFNLNDVKKLITSLRKLED